MILTTIAAALILIPILVLWELQPAEPSQARQAGRLQLLAIFLFAMAFSASCSIFTKAQREVVLGATVAYCAVLVLFLGNTSSVVIVSGHG